MIQTAIQFLANHPEFIAYAWLAFITANAVRGIWQASHLPAKPFSR